MKTVGLITMHRVLNCGSFLQAYATVKAVERLGYDCTVIDYLYPMPWHLENAVGNENVQEDNRRFRRLKKLFRMFGVLRYVKRVRTYWRLHRALREFRDFSGVKLTCAYSRKSILKSPPRFDVYLTGSDQTWNPRYVASDHSFLLDFTPEPAKRIAYAASFGCNELPVEHRKDYAGLLNRYSAISVREESGVPMVKDLCGKDASFVLDPTLLLTADEWHPLEADNVSPGRRFVFVYALSYVFDPFPDIVELADRVAKELNAEVIFYTDAVSRSELRDSGFSVISSLKHPLAPSEFLEYIDKSVFVISTSFHGTAFAVNFHKDFYAYLNPHPSKDDRVKSFLSSIGLEDRGVKERSDDLKIKTTYTVADERLCRLRERSEKYLHDAIAKN